MNTSLCDGKNTPWHVNESSREICLFFYLFFIPYANAGLITDGILLCYIIILPCLTETDTFKLFRFKICNLNASPKMEVWGGRVFIIFECRCN